MAKKDNIYFDNFTKCADLAYQAAVLLESALKNFDVNEIDKKREEIHEIEHAADAAKHEMIAELVRAFITPIERDDILRLSQLIDDVTDAIDDILIHIYINNIRTLRPDSIPFAGLIVTCCKSLKDMMVEFADFKKSKRLIDCVIDVNRLEEEGDVMYLNAMRELHTTSTDPIEIIVWREIYDYLEKCCDACEHIADVVESISIQNS